MSPTSRPRGSLFDLAPFAAVYASTAIAGALNVGLISAMPQGFRFTADMAQDLAAATLMTVCGLVLFLRLGYPRIGLVCLAYANVAALKTLNFLAHLAPAYLGRSYAIIDDALARWDAALGFDWLAYFHWHMANPGLAVLCRIAYLAWPYLALVLLVALAVAGDTVRMSRLIVATSLALALVYLVAIVTPSYGAYVQHGLTADRHPGFAVQFSDYKPTYDALRAGVVDLYAAALPSGAISFPSFHTTTVLLYVWASWTTAMRWPMLVLQTLSFLAIPVQGAHFASDMLIGGAIGLVAILLSRVLVGAPRTLPTLRPAAVPIET